MAVGKTFLLAICTLLAVSLSAADPTALTEAQTFYLHSAMAAYSSTLSLTESQNQEIWKAFSDYLQKDLMSVLTKLHLVEKWVDMQRDAQFRSLNKAYLQKKNRKDKLAVLKELKRLQKDYYPELDMAQNDPSIKKATRKLQQRLNKIINSNSNSKQ